MRNYATSSDLILQQRLHHLVCDGVPTKSSIALSSDITRCLWSR